MRLTTLIAAAALSVTGTLAPAQSTAPASLPASAPATAPVALRAYITAVEGNVQVRINESAPWVKAAEGMELGEGAEFRTGLRSAVQFEIPPDQVITLDRLGTCKVLDAVKVGKVVKTDLGMKYGRVRYDIEAAGNTYDAQIRSPGAALAVRGTKFSLYNQPPFKTEAVSLTGAVELRNAKRQRVTFGGKNKTTVSGDDTSAAQTSLTQALILEPGLQRTDQQIRELNFLFAQQGSLLGNVAASTVAVTDAQLPSLLGGRLNFVLRWSDPEAADLNLLVRTPLDETFGNPPFIYSFFPGNADVGALLAANLPPTTPSGGQIGLNHIGPEGIEIASFKDKFPLGSYVIGVYNFLPPDPDNPSSGVGPKVPFKVEVFLDGKRQGLITNLDAALAGTADPVCGFVFNSSVAVGERQLTLLPLTSESGSLCGVEETTATRARTTARTQSTAKAPATARKPTLLETPVPFPTHPPKATVNKAQKAR